MNGWKYYNRAMIPNCAPHENADVESVESRKVFLNGSGKKAVLARWDRSFRLRTRDGMVVLHKRYAL